MVSRCRRLFDLDADPRAIDAALAADEVLAPLVAARPGLRVPGAYDGFELAVRAVIGQQVSVRRRQHPDGTAGRALRHPAGGAAGPTGPLSVLFPGPADLADADLSGLGLTTARQATLRALAAACAAGRLNLDPGADPEETAARLAELPGVGPWTVAYILMRARRPGRLPGQRSRAAPGHGAAGQRARARRPVAALAGLRRPPPLGGPGRARRPRRPASPYGAARSTASSAARKTLARHLAAT